MRLTRQILSVSSAVVMSVAQAAACGLHPAPGGTLDVAYPGSLSVAVAVASAKDKSLLPASDRTRSVLGYMVAAGRLEAFTAALRTQLTARLVGGFSLVLVGPRLWTTVAFDGRGMTTRVHAPGPTEGWPVVMTDFLVIDAILDDRLDIQDALALGLVRIDRDDDQSIETLLVASLTRHSRTAR